ncbi:MAG: cytochrome c class [Myxococcales bacterium]|nr:cytochrome c class [Myxococcales bacterium]
MNTPGADLETGARVLPHDYDGIREYDNPMPGWWKSIFIGSVMFAGFYGLYFHLMDWGHTDAQAYRLELADYDSKKEVRARAEAANVSENALASGARDPRMLEHGAAVFKTKCVTCHADDGRGLIGPNLTDLRQLHGATRMDLYATITNGVPGTAMLAWGEQLPQTDILAVAAFVTTLRGQNIAGKAPEGVAVERFAP